MRTRSSLWFSESSSCLVYLGGVRTRHWNPRCEPFPNALKILCHEQDLVLPLDQPGILFCETS